MAVTAGVAAVVGVVSSEKSRKQQKKASRVQERVRQVQNARDRMSQVRQQRIAQAQIVQGAATQGTAQSSAAQGGYSAVGSLSSGNMQFLNQMDSLSQTIQGHMNKASQYSGQASMLNAVSNLALAKASMASPATPSQTTGGASTVLNSGAQISGTVVGVR